MRIPAYDRYKRWKELLEKEKLTEMATFTHDGITFTGSQDKLDKIKRSLGIYVEDGVHYNSSTKGIVRIVDMDDRHIKNALRKLLTAGLAKLDTNASNADFLAAVMELQANVTIRALTQRLVDRRFVTAVSAKRW